MSQHDHNSASKHHKPRHGSERSYIIGFVLSLIFTFIPYYLVVNHVITGNVLFGTILGIGVIQMIIQVVFFLHLGRERKPRWQLWFLMGTVVAILVVVGGSWFILRHLHHNMSPTEIAKTLAENEGIAQVNGKPTGACQGAYTLHKVTIRDGVVIPKNTIARYCDRLVLINDDGDNLEIAFGEHNHHTPYNGVTEFELSDRRPETIILSQTGTYRFHDHDNPSTFGFFTVDSDRAKASSSAY